MVDHRPPLCRSDASVHPIVSAALRYYGQASMLSIRNEDANACPFGRAVAEGNGTVWVGKFRSGADRDSVNRWRCLVTSLGRGADESQIIVRRPAEPIDILYLDRPRAGEIRRFFPLLSNAGVLIADAADNIDGVKREAATYADELGLIAVYHLGQVVLSRIDVVAEFDMTEMRYGPLNPCGRIAYCALEAR